MSTVMTQTVVADKTGAAADLPILDYSKLTGASDEKRLALRQLDEAFQTYGFMYLENHSVPQELIEEAFEWSKRFFSLPKEVKETIAHPPSGALDDHRGFAQEGLGLVSQLVFDTDKVQELRKTTFERKQTLEMGNPYGNKNAAPNKWLAQEHLPGLRAFTEKWWDECTKLERSLLQLLGQSLELEDDLLLCKKQSQDLCHMSWAYYPSMPLSVLNSGQERRLNAHTDFAGLTLLFQDMVGGLEIHDGELFRPVVPRKGTVVLNVGDMLERQSNGRWKSGLHRVVAPTGKVTNGHGTTEESVVDRYSIIYFGQPDPESIVDTLPGCEQRGKWKPNMIGEWDEITTCREWLQKRVAAEY